MLLGGLIFMADALLIQRNAQDAYRIVVTQKHLDALAAAFHSEHQREPTDAELQVRLQQWLDEQMLYQQARVLGLDERDAIVHRQMVQKMRFLLADASAVPDPSEAQLEAWLAAHPERYGHHPRLSFEQVYLSRGAQGEAMGEAVRRVVSHLRLHADDFMEMGDPFPAGQVLHGLDEQSIRRDFGRDFYARLVALEAGSWQGPIASSLGLHMVRITDRNDFQPARLGEVRTRVENDWRIHQREQANARAMEQLRQKFRVEYQVADEAGAG